MERNRYIEIARDTLNIFDIGAYTYQNHDTVHVVSVQQLHRSARKQAMLLKEEDPCMSHTPDVRKYHTPACVEIVNQPILDVFIHRRQTYGVLNFASAYHAGGGFLNGAMAQEESLCYGSDLYDLQLQFTNDFYHYNRQRETKCYSDRMIYTPNTVFIKNASYQLLHTPKLANVLTSPAVNLGAALHHGESEEHCYLTMKNRMRKILSVFAKKGNDAILLGAYGCGVFRNDPSIVATYWKELLYEEGWIHQFQSIVFAVYDPSYKEHTYQTFRSIIK